MSFLSADRSKLESILFPGKGARDGIEAKQKGQAVDSEILDLQERASREDRSTGCHDLYLKDSISALVSEAEEIILEQRRELERAQRAKEDYVIEVKRISQQEEEALQNRIEQLRLEKEEKKEALRKEFEKALDDCETFFQEAIKREKKIFSQKVLHKAQQVKNGMLVKRHTSEMAATCSRRLSSCERLNDQDMGPECPNAKSRIAKVLSSQTGVFGTGTEPKALSKVWSENSFTSNAMILEELDKHGKPNEDTARLSEMNLSRTHEQRQHVQDTHSMNGLSTSGTREVEDGFSISGIKSSVSRQWTGRSVSKVPVDPIPRLNGVKRESVYDSKRISQSITPDGLPRRRPSVHIVNFGDSDDDSVGGVSGASKYLDDRKTNGGHDLSDQDESFDSLSENSL